MLWSDGRIAGHGAGFSAEEAIRVAMRLLQEKQESQTSVNDSD